MLKRLLVLAFIAASLLVVAFGCGESDWKRCYSGDYISCSCDGGDFGYAQCTDHETFGACVCNGQTPGLDASTDGKADQ